MNIFSAKEPPQRRASPPHRLQHTFGRYKRPNTDKRETRQEQKTIKYTAVHPRQRNVLTQSPPETQNRPPPHINRSHTFSVSGTNLAFRALTFRSFKVANTQVSDLTPRQTTHETAYSPAKYPALTIKCILFTPAAATAACCVPFSRPLLRRPPTHNTLKISLELRPQVLTGAHSYHYHHHGEYHSSPYSSCCNVLMTTFQTPSSTANAPPSHLRLCCYDAHRHPCRQQRNYSSSHPPRPFPSALLRPPSPPPRHSFLRPPPFQRHTASP